MFHLDTLSIRRLYGSQLLFLPSDKQKETGNTFIEDAKDLNPTTIEDIKKVEVPEIVTKLLPEPQTPVQVSSIEVEVLNKENNLPFSSGQMIDWKSRKNAKIVVILHEEEFRNRFLTNGLRFFISDIGISFENVNFGIYKENTDLYNLTDMPHLIGILFTKTSPIESNLYKTKDKIIYISSNLLALAGDVALQEQLKHNLLEIKNLL